MKPKSELMARLRARRQAEGLVRLEFWVPRDAAQTVKDYVARLLHTKWKRRAAVSAGAQKERT